MFRPYAGEYRGTSVVAMSRLGSRDPYPCLFFNEASLDLSVCISAGGMRDIEVGWVVDDGGYVVDIIDVPATGGMKIWVSD